MLSKIFVFKARQLLVLGGGGYREGRLLRSGGLLFKISTGRAFTRLHLNQYLCIVVCLSSQLCREPEIRRIEAPGQPRQKNFRDTISTEKIWVWWCTPVIPAMAESIKSEDRSPGPLGHKC
jgi:hypothetical protein